MEKVEVNRKFVKYEKLFGPSDMKSQFIFIENTLNRAQSAQNLIRFLTVLNKFPKLIS